MEPAIPPNIALPSGLLRGFSGTGKSSWQTSRRITIREAFPLTNSGSPKHEPPPLRRIQTSALGPYVVPHDVESRPPMDRKTSVPVGRRSWLTAGLQLQRPHSNRFSDQRLRADSIGTKSIQAEDHFTVAKAHRYSYIRPAIESTVDPNIKDEGNLARKGSIYDTYEKAKSKAHSFQRKRWAQVIFEYGVYVLLVAFVYLVLIGLPLWKGAVYWLYWVVDNKVVITGGFAITIGLPAFYAFAPLFILFEPYPPSRPQNHDPRTDELVKDTALLIPCYKSAALIANTLEPATRIFPPEQIFVIANGNSPTPLDNTEEVCKPYGVNHVRSGPVGSKIAAQFVGCFATRAFKYALLIDDNCALPSNFPIVSDRMSESIKCIGYTIKSVGPGSIRGTLCQQAQDLEYKLSGLQRAVAGKLGSATFPHGAIVLWDRDFLLKTFYKHPGFAVSEDWFFGHVARLLGSRIIMCTSVFVETETPSSVFFSIGGARGGFGEMTIFQQRFKRWNFFFVNGMWYNLAYIFGSWRLGWSETGAKIFVFQEVYETLLYLLTPFILPISFIVRPAFCGYMLAGTIVLYILNVVVFNEIHLRLKKERVGSVATYIYYMPYKLALTAINVASCYWSLYKYARYFARRHPKIIEDEKAVEVVLRFEENKGLSKGIGRRLTVKAVDITGAVEVESAPPTHGQVSLRLPHLPPILEVAPAANGLFDDHFGNITALPQVMPSHSGGWWRDPGEPLERLATTEVVDFAAAPEQASRAPIISPSESLNAMSFQDADTKSFNSSRKTSLSDSMV